MNRREVFEDLAKNSRSSSREPDWDRKPWFALATWKADGCFDCVLITQRLDAYCEAWHDAVAKGLSTEVWCGTFREVEAFRVRVPARLTDT